MPRRPGRLLVAAALIAISLAAAACGGRFKLPPTGNGAAPLGANQGRSSGSTTTAEGDAATTVPPTLPVGATPPGATSPAPTPRTTVPSTGSTQTSITHAFEAYLVDLSGLDDTLNKAYIGPMASVTTHRLAQATVRQAAAILRAQEHGVGTLRDDHVAITLTGNSSAAVVDCQDNQHFYLVSDDSASPDPFVERGYFVGSAQLVLQGGQWLVDTFTTTHVACAF